MAFRDRLRRLRRLSEGGAVAIPQRDGTVKRFPQHELRAAFIEDVDRTAGRLGAETPVHPLLVAIHNASETAPLGLFMGGGEGRPGTAEDLSEGPS